MRFNAWNPAVGKMAPCMMPSNYHRSRDATATEGTPESSEPRTDAFLCQRVCASIKTLRLTPLRWKFRHCEADMERPKYGDTDDLPLSELMTQWPQTIPVFVKYKMLCVGCMVSSFHTVDDACKEHGVDDAVFRADLHKSMGCPTKPEV